MVAGLAKALVSLVLICFNISLFISENDSGCDMERAIVKEGTMLTLLRMMNMRTRGGCIFDDICCCTGTFAAVVFPIATDIPVTSGADDNAGSSICGV